MANSLSFNQCATLLASINAQATGKAAIAPVDNSQFVAVAQTTLLTGYDKVINSISQVLSKTVFSVRPYNRKFKGIHVDAVKYGNHVRKLTVIDKNPDDDDRQKLVDGESIDQQKVNKPGVLQTNYYGAEVYQRSVTIFRDQLDVAFSSAEEFGRFISMVLQNVSDLIEQDHENCARATLVNYMAGKINAGVDNINVVKLITAYNGEKGTEYTAETIRGNDAYADFIKWAIGYIKTMSDMMTERTQLFHTNITDKPVSRHTPHNKQKLYMLSKEINEMHAGVFSSVFNDEYLKAVDFERVSFWQSVKTPSAINVKCNYMDADGTIKTASVSNNNVFAVLFDEEAAGVTTVNAWTASAPFNARGGYSNTFWHFTDRYYNDFTENGIVFLLE